MIRLIIRLCFLALLAALFVMLNGVEGRSVIDFGPWQVQLQTSLLFFSILGTIVISGGIMVTFALAWARTHNALSHRRSQKRIGRLQHMLKGYALVAAEQPNKARRHVVSLKENDIDYVASGVLAALADPKSDEKARQKLEAALDDPDLVPLAIKGLMSLKSVQQDPETMNALVDTAAEVAGEAPWSQQVSYDRAIAAGDWTGAVKLVADHGRAADEKRAALVLEGARKALEEGDVKTALKSADRASKYAPHWSPAVVISIQAMVALGRKRRAFSLLKSVWQETPHADLVDAFNVIVAKENPEVALKKARQLVGESPSGYAGRLLMTQTLLRTNRTEQASLMLNGLTNDYPVKPVLKLRAKIAEQSDSDQVTYWMRQVAEASETGLWGCNSCGHSDLHWSFVCPSCGSPGTIEWRSVQAPVSNDGNRLDDNAEVAE